MPLTIYMYSKEITLTSGACIFRSIISYFMDWLYSCSTEWSILFHFPISLSGILPWVEIIHCKATVWSLYSRKYTFYSDDSAGHRHIECRSFTSNTVIMQSNLQKVPHPIYSILVLLCNGAMFWSHLHNKLIIIGRVQCEMFGSYGCHFLRNVSDTNYISWTRCSAPWPLLQNTSHYALEMLYFPNAFSELKITVKI